MTPLELGLVGILVVGIVYKTLQTYTAYRRSPAFLSRQETSLSKAANKAQHHHNRALDALSNMAARHQMHLEHAERLIGKLT